MPATWFADLTLRTPTPITNPDHLFDLMEAFAAHAPSASGADGRPEIGLSLAMEAETAQEAFSKLMQALEHPLTVDAMVTSCELRDAEHRDAQLAEPQIPELATLADIGEILGVTRQRAGVLAKRPDFPAPLISTGNGPLYGRAAVAAWNEKTERKPGRPRQKTLVASN